MNEQININTWFSDRELNFRPSHFIVTDSPITTDSLQWIFENLTGRFCLVQPHYSQPDFNHCEYPAFEDPAEATYFQLIWK